MILAFRLPGLCLITATSFAVLSAGRASAVTLVNGFKGQGLDHLYGSYAPRGDCAREPRVTIDDKGFTFRANGRTVTPLRVDYAVSFWGGHYEGITAVFYPFMVSDSNLGGVLMFVNDDETRGVIRFEGDYAPGQRADPFHSAFTGARTFTLCKDSQPAGTLEPPRPEQPVSVSGIPMEWNNLEAHVGKYPGSYSADNIDLFDKGAVAGALKSRLGPKMQVLKTNLSVTGGLKRQGNLYLVSGNAQHKGGEEQAYVLIDPARRAVQVGLWEKGKLTVYAPATGARIPAPADIAKMLANSPLETAVALPGTPWEVVPVQGSAPMAYVSAAGSPDIQALSLYCQNGRSYMAMLLNKRLSAAALTVTWNFAGRLVNIPVQRANRTGTQWIGPVAGTPLIPLLTQQKGTVMLRINGRGEGEASLINSTTALRTALQSCVRL